MLFRKKWILYVRFLNQQPTALKLSLSLFAYGLVTRTLFVEILIKPSELAETIPLLNAVIVSMRI